MTYAIWKLWGGVSFYVSMFMKFPYMWPTCTNYVYVAYHPLKHFLKFLNFRGQRNTQCQYCFYRKFLHTGIQTNVFSIYIYICRRGSVVLASLGVKISGSMVVVGTLLMFCYVMKVGWLYLMAWSLHLFMTYVWILDWVITCCLPLCLTCYIHIITLLWCG